jgi:imidazolonepropionase-like amidohydrolase
MSATFYARRPTTRMGVVWEFKKAFLDAKEREGGVLQRAMEGKLPVRVAASRATDIESLLGIAQELGLSVVLEEAQEAYKLADRLAARKIPVLLRPEFSVEGTEGSEVRFDAFRTLLEKGVRVALLPAQADNPDSLLGAAALAVKHGARPGEALRAVTIRAAEILGVADRVGSLEAGKDADLVILSGDPLNLCSRVEKVVIGGRVVYGGRNEK